MKRSLVLLLVVLVVLLLTATTRACTTMAVGRLATSDGSVIVTQSDDGDGQIDARPVAVPAQSYPPNSQRPIFPDALIGYPRYVGSDRGDIPPYATNSDDPTPQKPTGSIPQISSTYAFWEGDYGILNSEGVGVGETSCSARILAPADTNETQILLPIESLTRLAMERTNSSRSAVQLMGQLAELHGFYGVLRSPASIDTVPNEAGESCMVGDKNEAWVFHILSDGKNGAIWVAQRVDDDKVAVVANMFTIRQVDLQDAMGATFLYSNSMTSVAKEHGWWQEGDPFDFTAIYSYGEYYAQGYSSKRMWRAMSLLSPSLDLNMTIVPPLFRRPQYPWSVVPDKKIVPTKLMAIHRDYYQNTSIDMSVGPASGPWGLPVRFNPEQAYWGKIPGNWHRPMGSFRTAYTIIVQLKQDDDDVVHFAPHSSLGSTFIPIFGRSLQGTTGDGTSPFQARGLDVADPRANGKGVDRTSFYWGARYALNIAYSRFRDMHPIIVEQQRVMEERSARLVEKGTSTALEAAETTNNHTSMVLAAWWNVSDQMIVHWSDGFFNEAFSNVDTEYPKWWLKEVGYQNGPPNPISNVVF